MWCVPFYLAFVFIPFFLFAIPDVLHANEMKEYTLEWINEKAGCGELKSYVLDEIDNDKLSPKFKENAKERFIWMCEK